MVSYGCATVVGKMEHDGDAVVERRCCFVAVAAIVECVVLAVFLLVHKLQIRQWWLPWRLADGSGAGASFPANCGALLRWNALQVEVRWRWHAEVLLLRQRSRVSGGGD